MKYLLKFCLLAVLLLGFAATLPAQRFISGPAFSPYNSGFGGVGGYGYSGYGGDDYGWGYDFGGLGFSDDCLHHPEEHPPFSVGFAHGDPDFIQSSYMDYNKALELGKKILEEQAKPQPSWARLPGAFGLRKENIFLLPRLPLIPLLVRTSGRPRLMKAMWLCKTVTANRSSAASSEAVCRKSA